MNFVMMIVIGLVFGILGGMLMVFVCVKTGYFAKSKELDDFTVKFTDDMQNFASHLADEFAKVDRANHSMDNRISIVEARPSDIDLVREEWENHKRWSLEMWNEIMHTKDSYLTEFQTRDILDQTIRKLENVPIKTVAAVTDISEEELLKRIREYVGPMGPVYSSEDGKQNEE